MNPFKFNWLKLIISFLIIFVSYYFSLMFRMVGTTGMTQEGYVLVIISILSLFYFLIILTMGIHKLFKK